MFGTIMNDEEKKEGLEIIEEDAFEPEISDEELEQFYEDNKDAIDLIGGLDMFESLMSLDDETFIQLKPQVLQLFAETLHEPESISEFRTLAIAQGYTQETAKADFEMAIDAINEIDFLSEAKKDFLKEIYTMASNQLAAVIGTTGSVIRIPCEVAEGIQIPVYVHETDAGMDIFAWRQARLKSLEQVLKSLSQTDMLFSFNHVPDNLQKQNFVLPTRQVSLTLDTAMKSVSSWKTLSHLSKTSTMNSMKTEKFTSSLYSMERLIQLHQDNVLPKCD